MKNSTHDAPIDALSGKLNWPIIYEIIKRMTATMVYKSLDGLVPIYLYNIFLRNFTRDTVYLRNYKTDESLFKTANWQKSFRYCRANAWKNLKSKVINAPSVSAFKHRL